MWLQSRFEVKALFHTFRFSRFDFSPSLIQGLFFLCYVLLVAISNIVISRVKFKVLLSLKIALSELFLELELQLDDTLLDDTDICNAAVVVKENGMASVNCFKGRI
ncbi:hypothetical protein KC330_g8430 [Hortaea werneckii]|nr:hypothetical protein KC330_g8430 [Hortaea werneckii]